jgi:hypothetical protein
MVMQAILLNQDGGRMVDIRDEENGYQYGH